MKRDIDAACMMALGEVWHGTLWIAPLVTGQASIPYTLTGRKNVAAAQLQAVAGIGGSPIAGMRFLPAWSQFAPYFTEGDLVHGSGYYFRGYGEAIGAMLAQDVAGTGRSVPYMTGKTVISVTQAKVTWSEDITIPSVLPEATTAGVKAGLEAYTAGGVQLPLTDAVQTGPREITVTMASTATLSVIRNGLAQETVGAATKMPRTRVAAAAPLTTAADASTLYLYSPAQEI